ncbi:MAG: hypothetical protein O7E53_03185 [Alphaproteobacteria bacterium]|nr:hypothetical protein [Alphaproteobacteria bacterium]
MTGNRFAMYFTVGNCVTGILAVAMVIAMGGALAAAEGPVPQLIHDNKLLKVIYQKDPQTALGLAAEIESYLAATAKDKQPAAGEKAPELKFRGDADTPAPGRDDDILSRNKKTFDENPVLRNVYYRSPIASLRLLRRFREAANQIKK